MASVALLQAPAWAEPFQMTVKQALEAQAALQGLDGYEQVLKEGGAERGIKVPYKLSGLVRLAIARDLAKVAGAVNEYQTARKAVLASAGEMPKPGSVEERRMVDEIGKMLETQVPGGLDLTRLTPSDLGLANDLNPIPPSLIAGLGPIFDDGSDGKAAAQARK